MLGGVYMYARGVYGYVFPNFNISVTKTLYLNYYLNCPYYLMLRWSFPCTIHCYTNLEKYNTNPSQWE